MAQSGNASTPASPPFASPSGQPKNQGTGASGAHDFTTDPKGSGAGSGPGYLLKDRPQSEAKPEVVPNKESVPAGGAILKADPGPVSKVVAGAAPGPLGVSKVPFKSLK